MSWYSANWQFRVKVTIDKDKVFSVYTDYPVMLTEANFPSHFFDTAKSDGSDIVVTSSDGTTKLDRDLISYSNSTDKMLLRVRIASLSSSADTDLYVYYGYSGASETNTTDTYSSDWKWYQPMQEDPSGSAPQFIDRTSNDMDGTSGGTMTSGDLIDGILGKCIDFDGSDDQIQLGTDAYPTSGTLQFWLRTDNAPGTRKDQLFRVRDAAIANSFDCSFWDNNLSYSGWVEYSVDDDRVSVNTTTNWSVNTWHLFTAHWTNGGTTAIFADTTLDGTTATLSATWDTAGRNQYIATADNSTQWFDGRLSHFRVLSHVTGSDEIQTVHANESSPSTFYAVASAEAVVLMPDADATAATTAPSIAYGSTEVTGAAVDAAGSVVAPSVGYGSTSVVGAMVAAVAGVVAPSVAFGSVSVVGVTTSAAADTVAPTALGGDALIIGAMASAVSAVNGPTVVLGSTIVTGTVASAVPGIVAPSVLIASWITTVAASAATVTVDPSIEIDTPVTPSFAEISVDTVAPSFESGQLNWFWSDTTKGWFRDSFKTANHNPFATAVIDGDLPDDRTVLLGGQDGYIRQFDKLAKDDDSSAIESYAILGPISDQTTSHQVILSELQGITAHWSSSVNYEVLRGSTPYDAVQSASSPMSSTHTIEAGRSYTDNPRIRGQYLYVKVGTSSTTSAWALELLRAKVIIVSSDSGRRLN